MGNGETILPHEVQRMTAGTGVLHSEYSSPTDRTHLLQIWILPEKQNLSRAMNRKSFRRRKKGQAETDRFEEAAMTVRYTSTRT